MVLGHVTCDIIRREGQAIDTRLGGSASFAVLAAATLGYETILVTAAPPESKLLKPLYESANITLHVKACPKPTTFELDYTGDARRLRLLNRAPPLLPENVPTEARGARVAYVCPVMGECGPVTMATLHSDCVVVAAQGWLRRASGNGEILPTVLPDAKAVSGVRAVCFSELDHPESDALAGDFAARVDIVALTRGANGVTLYHGEHTVDVPAVPANEVDPTGAGDVFGVVFALGLHAGKTAVEAAQIAMRVAARVVEGPGLGRLAAVDETLLDAL